MPASHSRCLYSSPGFALQPSSLLICTQRGSKWWPGHLGHCHPCGRCNWRSWLLPSAWPSPSSGGPLGRDRRSSFVSNPDSLPSYLSENKFQKFNCCYYFLNFFERKQVRSYLLVHSKLMKRAWDARAKPETKKSSQISGGWQGFYYLKHHCCPSGSVMKGS